MSLKSSASGNRPGEGVKLPMAIPALMMAFAAVALLVAALAGCCAPARSNSDLVVTSIALQAEASSDEGRTPIRVRFSHAVVAQRQVGAALSQPPVVMHPPVHVAASWTDRQTLLVRPLVALRPSTRYRLALTGTLPELLGAYTFSFVHRPLQVEQLSGVDPAAAPPVPSFALRFNQPVEANLVARRCALRPVIAPGATAPAAAIALDTPDGGQQLMTIRLVVAVAARLELGREYELRCERLVGAGGDAMMEEPYARRLRVHL